jgi:hypothetical protein
MISKKSRTSETLLQINDIGHVIIPNSKWNLINICWYCAIMLICLIFLTGLFAVAWMIYLYLE